MKLIVLIFVSVCGTLNTTMIKTKDELIQGSINIHSKSKVVFSSRKSFELTLYTDKGDILRYKGYDVAYVGHPTWYEIKSVYPGTLKVNMDIYAIETDINKILVSIIAVVSMSILILYKRDHVLSQVALLILLSIELYKTSDYTRIADRIIHKILF